MVNGIYYLYFDTSIASSVLSILKKNRFNSGIKKTLAVVSIAIFENKFCNFFFAGTLILNQIQEIASRS
jgi:hypothetical protein